MLAGAVLGERRRGSLLGPPAGGGLRVERDVGGVLQVVDAQARAVEDPPDPVEVRRLAPVAGGGEGEQLAGEVEAGVQHRHGLHRLERGAREEGDVRIADGERSHAPAVHRDEVAVVHGFDHVTTYDVGHGGGAGSDLDDHPDHGTCLCGDSIPDPSSCAVVRPQTALTAVPMLRKKITIASIALPM